MSGFNIAYFLWNIRGSNNLNEITYYKKFFSKMSDDETSLRGAYGPRLRYWVGADQLQESIDANRDIEKEEEFQKPLGIDQLQKVYDDLKNGVNTSCCQIFNPSIDFDETNYVPDLVSIGFSKKGSLLNMTPVYLQIPENKIHAEADSYFHNLLIQCMASILALDAGYVNILNLQNNCLVSTTPIKLDITNKTPESLWNDIHRVLDMERYMRNHVTKDTVKMDNVDVISRIELGMKEYIDKITCQHWKDCCYILIGTALRKYGVLKYDEWIRKSILCNIKVAVNKIHSDLYLESKNG